MAPSLDPSVGILINLSPDHIDRHGTMEHYAEVKERLVAGAEIALVGIDDEFSDAIGRRWSGRDKPNVIPVSAARELSWGYFVRGTEVVSKGYDKTPEQAEVLGNLDGGGLAARPPQRAERGVRLRRGAGTADSLPRRSRKG